VSELILFAPTILSGEAHLPFTGPGVSIFKSSGSFTLKKLECLKQAFFDAFEYISME